MYDIDRYGLILGFFIICLNALFDMFPSLLPLYSFFYIRLTFSTFIMCMLAKEIASFADDRPFCRTRSAYASRTSSSLTYECRPNVSRATLIGSWYRIETTVTVANLPTLYKLRRTMQKRRSFVIDKWVVRYRVQPFDPGSLRPLINNMEVVSER